MKNFKNFAQAENALNELQCSKCKYDLSHYPDYFKSSRKDTDSKFRNYNNKYRHKLYLQPEWSKSKEMTPKIIEYVMKNPQWEISLQTHKFLNIP